MAMMTSKCSLPVLSEAAAAVPLQPQLPQEIVPATFWQLQLPLQQPLQVEVPPTIELSLF